MKMTTERLQQIFDAWPPVSESATNNNAWCMKTALALREIVREQNGGIFGLREIALMLSRLGY